MKPIGELKILNRMPHILMSHEDLCAIQHVVKVAPKEAQWFHCVERVNNNDNIYYKVSGMYIPEQYCSAVEVESDPMMMVKFYKELKEEHGEEETNNILASMTAWSHSHHDMGVSPSGQDRKQFHEQCIEAEKQNITAPQLMLIFNRKDDYYARLWDPELGMEYENLSILLETYDFSWIDEAAKTKFKKKQIIKKPTMWGQNKSNRKQTNGLIDFNQFEMFGNITTPSQSVKPKKKERIKRKTLKQEFNIALWRQSKKYNDIIALEEEIDKCLSQIEKNKSTENVQKLISLIRTEIGQQEFMIMRILLCGSEEEIFELEEYLPKNTQSNYEEALIEIHDEFIDGILTADTITNAMTSAIECKKADSAETAERVLDMWLTIYYSVLDPSDFHDNSVYDLYSQELFKEV